MAKIAIGAILWAVTFARHGAVGAEPSTVPTTKPSAGKIATPSTAARSASRSSGPLPNWYYTPEGTNANFRSMVVGNIDANLDGYADLLIGEPDFHGGEGRVLVLLGGPLGFSMDRAQALTSEPGWTGIGNFLVSVGDTDGNGRVEVAINEQSKEDQHRVHSWIWEAAPGGLIRKRVWLKANFISAAGDFNGDGYGDVITRDWNHATNAIPGLCVALVLGSKEGLQFKEAWRFCEETPGAEFGHDLANVGDINGDGCDDLLVGAMKYSGRLNQGGKAYLFHGGRNGLSSRPDWTSEYPLVPENGVDEQKQQFFSRGLGHAGDVNGDGFADVIIGASYADRGDRNEGLAFAFHGSSKGLGSKPDWIGEANHAHSLFGSAVVGVGDFNGDGFQDVAVGAPEASNGQQLAGAVLIYPGSKNGIASAPCWVIENHLSHEKLGSFIQAAGDVNGDGYADVLIITPDYEEERGGHMANPGRYQVVYGRPDKVPAAGSWSVQKPVLTGLQQRLDFLQSKYGMAIYWLPAITLFLGTISLGLGLHLRSRRIIHRLLVRNQKLVQEEERARLARDMHDHLGADLNQILLEAQSMSALLKNPVQAKLTLDSLQLSAEAALNNMNDLVWAIDPTHDTLEGLLDRITDFAARYLEKAQISCKFNLQEDIGKEFLNTTQRHNLFLATKEAIHNAAKHSRATTVRLSVTRAHDFIRIAIQDNGCGFTNEEAHEPHRVESSKSCPKPTNQCHGLKNITHRLETIGGVAEIRSSVGNGTIVTLILQICEHP